MDRHTELWAGYHTTTTELYNLFISHKPQLWIRRDEKRSMRQNINSGQAQNWLPKHPAQNSILNTNAWSGPVCLVRNWLIKFSWGDNKGSINKVVQMFWFQHFECFSFRVKRQGGASVSIWKHLMCIKKKSTAQSYNRNAAFWLVHEAFKPKSANVIYSAVKTPCQKVNLIRSERTAENEQERLSMKRKVCLEKERNEEKIHF